MTARDYIDGVLAGNRTILARAITLIESHAPRHAPVAAEVVHALLPHAGRSIRVGITGVPGVGKSTFIEKLGLRLCRAGHRLAVLAVDPSSALTGGSILGDKTRMEELAREPACFIRPTPSGGTPGGVARKSRETIWLCEAAGFDVMLVETVGVGQGEVTVRSMVDFFLLLLLTGAGDELQGIKKGIIEMADALVVAKADGANAAGARAVRAELEMVLHHLSSRSPGWRVPVLTCSAIEDSGVSGVWEVVERFRREAGESGFLTRQRAHQALDWTREMLAAELWNRFSAHPAVRREWDVLAVRILNGEIPPPLAVRQLLALQENHDPKN